jgi:hypothetical protein
MQIRLWCGALALAACSSGAAPGPVNPAEAAATSPEAAVRAFLQAVADSNVPRMSSLWGTEKGPASRTRQPADYTKRMEVVQLYLRNTAYTLGAIRPMETDPSKSIVNVVLDRKECQRTMPVTVVQTSKEGWLVNELDLNQAGSPSRPCRDAGADKIPPKP